MELLYGVRKLTLVWIKITTNKKKKVAPTSMCNPTVVVTVNIGSFSVVSNRQLAFYKVTCRAQWIDSPLFSFTKKWKQQQMDVKAISFNPRSKEPEICSVDERKKKQLVKTFRVCINSNETKIRKSLSLDALPYTLQTHTHTHAHALSLFLSVALCHQQVAHMEHVPLFTVCYLFVYA